MLYIIKNQLRRIINDIDVGNSNLSEDDAVKVIELLKTVTNKTAKLSKCQACRYLNISRASFDNMVREGRIPRGKKEAGFKELFWFERDLDIIIKSRGNGIKKNYNSANIQL